MKTKLKLSNSSHLWRNLSFGLIGLWLISAAALFPGLVPLSPTEVKGQMPGVRGQIAGIGNAGSATVVVQGQASVGETQAYRALVMQAEEVEQPAVAPKPATIMAGQDDLTAASFDEPAPQFGMTENSLMNDVLRQAQTQPTVVAKDKLVVSSLDASLKDTDTENLLKDELKALGLAIADLKNLLEDMNMQMSQIRVAGVSTEPVTTQLESLPPAEMTSHQPTDRQYTVKRGDVLSGIAADLDIKTGCLIAWNQLSYPYVIDVGQKLTLSGQKENCVPVAVWMAPYGHLAEADKTVQADKLNGLKIIGMSGRHLVLASGENSPVSMYTLGELIEGMGTLQSIDLAKRQAMTSSGIVLQADLSP